MHDRTARRGQPLVMLGAVVGLWTALRIVSWEWTDTASFAAPVLVEASSPRHPAMAICPRATSIVDAPDPGTANLTRMLDPEIPPQPLSASDYAVPRVALALPFIPAESPLHALRDTAPAVPRIPVPRLPVPVPVPVRLAAGHQLLWMAALSALPLASELETPRLPAGVTPPGPRAPVAASSRWSADGWLLLRSGAHAAAGVAAAGALGPSYGASQIGAVVRYRLNSSARAAALYVRATSGLERPRGATLAAGLALRPVPAIPLVVMAELRGGRGVHPALAAVTVLPPAALPLALRGELYVQVGYVAGGADATAFVDGQLRVDRRIGSLGSAELRAGGGVWGGAQKGAARLDIGPGATLHLARVANGARLALDWRFRVAGDAAPRSGPALTLSAGF